MLELFTCVDEVGTQQGCCTEQPYEALNPDCVELCLTRAIQSQSIAARESFLGSLQFGIQAQVEKWLAFTQDLDLLKKVIMLAFNERVAATYANEATASQDAFWSSWQMDCWVTYFRCRWSINIRPWLLDAGFYDPSTGVPQTNVPFFPPYLAPCGEEESFEDPIVLPWPPDCTLPEPDYWVEYALDASELGAVVPVSGMVVLIRSDHQGLNLAEAPVGQLTTWDGVQWVPSGALDEGTVIQAPIEYGYFTVVSGIAEPAFPGVFADNDPDSTPCTITLTSLSPSVSLIGNRTVLIEASIDGINWDNLGSVLETQLATPYIIETSCSEYIYIRSTYTTPDGCVYPPISGVFGPPSPESVASFTLRADNASSLMALTSYPAIHPIHFFNDNEWTLSFWYKADDATKGNRVFTLMSSVTPGLGVIMTISIDPIAPPLPVGGYLNIAIGRGVSIPSYSGFFHTDLSQPVLPLIFDQWNHFAIVRNGPIPLNDGVTPLHHGSVWKLYVNGILIEDFFGNASLINVPIATDLQYPVTDPPQGLVVGASAPYSTGNFVNGEQHLANIDEIYLCKSARTASEVANILMYNTMAANDGTWNRILWWRADGDASGADNVSSNVNTTPNATLQGNILIDTGNVPPIPS